MAVTFTVRYHSKVVADDIPALSPTWKERVRGAVESKLTLTPENYGKPLRQSLHGYRKLRVGDYRVVFRIERETVYVLAILHRSVVYKKAEERVKGKTF
ncbi:MAG TPA: type II toxin-antitoxin system RelE/ParE family toxin [Candidatus Paceibacterota bacterium]|uniref:Addiction module antitoxin RelB n=1 Tax=Candidatus Lloydbacteria bacterium RIFCSPHIGHO2_02_FULL_54_17 TaxID=1798664 RepID=A0A1G2DH91_9BACT|nr:MAG: hypothetical protein A2762_00995 [Candidatus Lloydbacteria bacterium RIFCSPHIGHO2_01_FULL_54_11]OGZ12331.1 MAG: hypothetical protein A3C93_03395 [Candidatus Lloydbacteria bacterium RIFCSPHIGHO2_02_FULL_54_17]OGZ14498.1 MAG: hypothetical protein A3H76_06065 [Candidatus Lloydbacteria bacterium RIFCSPLOWO2_02_FULL_54_12]OGZ14576.1 MAG: hypothetical protein A2948_05725 [Candidatus Lloydbacteria bacterium RIFCSPLOWO2_01_FULL_54_18]HXK31272.1 type II toxin-antitoxin system RelE/ParE family to